MNKIKTITKVLYALTASLVILLLVYFSSQLFKIKRIETTAKKEDMEGFPYLGEQYIFSVSQQDIKQYFLKNPQIKEVQITKKYPYTLNLEVVYRTELAQIISSNETFILDETGFIFKKSASVSALPVISLPIRKIDLGTNITQKSLVRALDIVNKTQNTNIRVVEIIPLDDETVSLTLSEGIKVIIDSTLKAEDIVSSLQMILKRFTIEGKVISKIDFRFDKPVVTF